MDIGLSRTWKLLAHMLGVSRAANGIKLGWVQVFAVK